MFNNKLNYKLINFTVLMLLLYISFSNIGMWWNIICTTLSVLAPFIIAFAFAYALMPILDFLTNKGIKKPLAVLIIAVSAVLIIAALLVVTLPLVYDQLILFSKNIIDIIGDLGEHLNLNLGTFEVKLTDQLNTIIGNLGNIVSSGTINVVNKSLNFLTKFLVGFISWVYFLSDMYNIRDKFKKITINISKRCYSYFKLLDNELGNYIKGLAIFMVIQLFEYSILFFMVGHPNWLLLGILACITTVIPYFGGLITNIIGIITASVIAPKVLIGTIIICIIFPQLDGYIISPRVYGKTNNVNPLATIIVVSIGGTLAGVTGIVVALPLYILLRATYHYFSNDLKKGMKKIKGNM